VRSFPIVAEEEVGDDVAAGKDQKKRAKAVKKATQEAVSAASTVAWTCA
jgi:hypothetical protein